MPDTVDSKYAIATNAAMAPPERWRGETPKALFTSFLVYFLSTAVPARRPNPFRAALV
jgi:hypothetical protein